MAQIKFSVNVGSSVTNLKKLDTSFIKMFERLSLINKVAKSVKENILKMCNPAPLKELNRHIGKTVAGLTRTKKEVRAIRREYIKTGKEASRANKQGAKLAGSFMKAGMALMGVSSAAALISSAVRFEIQRRRQAHDMMGQRLAGMERPTSRLTINLQALGTAAGRAFEKQLEAQRMRLGMPVTQYRTAASGVFSGVGADPGRTLEIMGTVGRIARAFAPEQLATLASSVAGLQSQMRVAFGGQVPSSKAAMGVMIAGMGQSRAANVQEFAPNFAKLLGAMLGQGGSIQTAIALSAGVTQGAEDPQTRISTTAAINVAVSTLREFLTDEMGIEKYRDRDKHGIDELLNFVMNQRPDVGKKFGRYLLEEKQLEAKARPAIAALFGNVGSQARVAFDNALASVPQSIKKFEEMADALLTRINEQWPTQQGDVNRALESLLDSFGMTGGVRMSEAQMGQFQSLKSLAGGMGFTGIEARVGQFIDAGVTVDAKEMNVLVADFRKKAQESATRQRDRAAITVMRDAGMDMSGLVASEDARGHVGWGGQARGANALRLTSEGRRKHAALMAGGQPGGVFPRGYKESFRSQLETDPAYQQKFNAARNLAQHQKHFETVAARDLENKKKLQQEHFDRWDLHEEQLLKNRIALEAGTTAHDANTRALEELYNSGQTGLAENI